jgi:hypothetical protein
MVAKMYAVRENVVRMSKTVQRARKTPCVNHTTPDMLHQVKRQAQVANMIHKYSSAFKSDK